MQYDTLTCTLHVYKPTVGPVASRRLFFDVQVVTLLLGEYTLIFFNNICSTLTCVYAYDGM